MRHFIRMAAVGAMLCVTAPAAAQAPFHLEEATIASVRSALASGQLTCTRLTKLYLDRIEVYNLSGLRGHRRVILKCRRSGNRRSEAVWQSLVAQL